MLDLLLPAAFALFLWWFGTGVLLHLNRTSRRVHRLLMALGLAAGAAALYGLHVSAGLATPAGAIVAFTCAIVLWAVVEMSYYLGFITGWHDMPCPDDAGEGRRFTLALGASMYHELTVLAAAGLVSQLTADGVNRTGLWAFLVLWLMRWSSKLNLFLGVSNFHADWLPEHLRYIASYAPRRRMNLLFPVSVTASTVLAVYLAQAALAAPANSLEQVSLVLVTTLLALAVLEHWFLILPVSDDALWSWALSSASAPDGASLQCNPALADASGTGVTPQAHGVKVEGGQ